MKIFFNGCSHTYGEELEDPKTQRYSALLECDDVNIARVGNSNDIIVKETIEWLENNTCDFVIVQFTLPTRFSHYDSKIYDIIKLMLVYFYMYHLEFLNIIIGIYIYLCKHCLCAFS